MNKIMAITGWPQHAKSIKAKGHKQPGPEV